MSGNVLIDGAAVAVLMVIGAAIALTFLAVLSVILDDHLEDRRDRRDQEARERRELTLCTQQATVLPFRPRQRGDAA